MADRKNQGKALMHLIPREAIEDEAAVFEFGMKKYSVGNWMTPPYFPREVLIDCVLRHAFAMAAGEDIDPESGLGHWAHIRCNMAMYAFQHRHGLFPDGNTRVHHEKRQEASKLDNPHAWAKYPEEKEQLTVQEQKIFDAWDRLAGEGGELACGSSNPPDSEFRQAREALIRLHGIVEKGQGGR